MIQNPILRGFNPDPSAIRVGDDFYIATSTFEWFPGVQIHHSKDLANWKLITHPLNRIEQLNLRGNPSSGGVWAPCLSYADGLFYLIYSDVKTVDGPFKDVDNYLVTAKDIMGPWSDPVYLNSSGFDPSLFHDSDGRKWLLNMLWDHRKFRSPAAQFSAVDNEENSQEHACVSGCFGGIIIQQYDAENKCLIGQVRNIFKGTHLGLVEGPHLYKRNGWYYLLTAESGTFYEHAVTLARSHTIFGPYQVAPHNPILTSANNMGLRLQKAGHGSLIPLSEKVWYMVHLCGRPLLPQKRCILGRETAIQRFLWTDDDWLKLEGGGNEPVEYAPLFAVKQHAFEKEPVRDDFDGPVLNVNYQTLRVPADESWLSLSKRKGYLAIRGKQSLFSKHYQSMVARRLQNFKAHAQTYVEFEPANFQQMAGLVCFYDCQNFYYLRITHDENLGKCIGIEASINGKYIRPVQEVVLKTTGCHLRAEFNYDKLQFYYSTDQDNWEPLGPVFDSTTLSDEHCVEGRFTGTFIGLCAQDMASKSAWAFFDYFEYCETA